MYNHDLPYRKKGWPVARFLSARFALPCSCVYQSSYLKRSIRAWMKEEVCGLQSHCWVYRYASGLINRLCFDYLIKFNFWWQINRNCDQRWTEIQPPLPLWYLGNRAAYLVLQLSLSSLLLSFQLPFTLKLEDLLPQMLVVKLAL